MLLHVGVGLLATVFRPAMIAYFLLVVVYFLYRIIVLPNKQREVLVAASYMVGAEVFFRMTKAYFLYETGKYMVIVFLVIGMIYHGFKRSSLTYFVYFLLLLPGVYVSYLNIDFDDKFRQTILFNLSGPICLTVAAMYCYGRTVTLKELFTCLDFLVYPIISMTIYVYFYNINIQEVITGTASTSATSGGFGPNQVATVLGLGAFALYSRFLIPYKNKILHLVMMFWLMAITHRAIITFSRGGVFVAIAMMGVFTFMLYFSSGVKTKFKLSYRIITVVAAILAIWVFSVLQTGGLIANRYANEDALGREKADVTTGRAKLIDADFQAFSSNPIFGLGVGQSKSYYEENLNTRIPSHNEISRMFSEHGVFGILALFILLFAPLISKMNGRRNIFFFPFIAFWLLTILHSSMRIAAPAFIYGLALLNINYETPKDTVRREQIGT
ncbi:O-antigen ligase family protein [Rasiella rasia]|uniref:O-antigen ligase family protein n=1 Tax=Rasiella rasia TaxID=2744027 RepID=A0A6G6GQ09_9FLAO|nr:O-antigen ligase family protein [Rasiella rasia]QIE60638.1 O-antigen ligase family protein [Rasiella rasia]